MSETLSAVWPSIKYYLANDISVIPIRDKDDENGVAKSPFGKAWKPYTEKIITAGALWHDMERFDTTAVGIICGKVSGNLEGIDADEKYMPGISARLFTDIKTLYPDLWPRLRIHGTPSKGFHILYRCTDPIDGNLKLAGRYKTDAELLLTPRPKVVNFLETRGENGYVAAPPSLNYTVVQDVPIPTLNKDERDALINLCRSYTYITAPTVEPYKPTKSDNEYYDTNPFEDFNNRCNPSELMTELGWAEFKHNNKFVWYTRPGKTKGVSMSFNIERRFFFCFTASTELEENHGYTPANLLCLTSHNGDKKRTYQDLVKRGYGVIKPAKEQQIVKRAAINNKPLPPNVSTAATTLHAEISKQLQTEHPYGTFWIDDYDSGSIIIDREKLYIVAEGLGYRLYNQDQLVQIVNHTIHNKSEREFYDTIKAYIKEEDQELYFRICNSYEPFIERHGKFTISRLQQLNEQHIIQDTRHDCYKFYKNGMLHITADGWQLKPLPTDKFIIAQAIQDRDFIDHNGGLYVDFLDKAIGITDYLLKCIGYMAHEYKMKNSGFCMFLSEQCQDPIDGGGSGKNIFSSLFAHTTTYFNTAGSQIKYDEKFFQSWNFEKIFSISDAKKNFDFEFLKEMVTGTATMKRLHVNTYSIPVDKMPKFFVSSQFSYELKEGGIKRRVRPIEFTDFFTKAGGVDKYYDGKIFPDDWSVEDWGGFDTTIALAVQTWLKQKDRKLELQPLTETGWHKQFEQTYKIVITAIIKENIDDWCARGFISLDEFKRTCTTYYNENSINQKYWPSAYNFNNALKDWCIKHNIIFNKDAFDTIQNATIRGKSFKSHTK